MGGFEELIWEQLIGSWHTFLLLQQILSMQFFKDENTKNNQFYKIVSKKIGMGCRLFFQKCILQNISHICCEKCPQRKNLSCGFFLTLNTKCVGKCAPKVYPKACFWTKSKCVRIVKGQFLPRGTFVPLLARVAAGSLIINRCGNNIKPLNILQPTNPLLLIWQQNTKLYGNQQDDPPSLPSPPYVSPPPKKKKIKSILDTPGF